MSEELKKLRRTNERLKLRLQHTQARLYDVEHADDPEPTEADLKSRIVWVEEEIKRISEQRNDLKRRLMNCERIHL